MDINDHRRMGRIRIRISMVRIRTRRSGSVKISRIWKTADKAFTFTGEAVFLYVKSIELFEDIL
jgi:hypothetical protein